MKRLNADPPPGRSKEPRVDGGGASGASSAPAGRLPDHLYQELAGLEAEHDEDAAVLEFIREGRLPTKPDDCTSISEFCILHGLTEHFTLVPPASQLTIRSSMNLDTVAEYLNGAPALRRLTLDGLDIDGNTADKIAALLRTIPLLEDLGIIACTISSAGMKAIIPQALDGNLKSLDITSIDLSGAMNALAPALRGSSLETLVLAFVSIGNDELRTLCAALADQKPLTKLVIVGQGDWDDGTALGELLRNHVYLTELHLVGCTGLATLPVLQALRDNACQLRCLEMPWTGVWEDGEGWFINVADMLSLNATLLKLDIRNSDLNDFSIAKLGQALEHNRSLRELKLGPSGLVTKLTRQGTDAFIQSLKRNVGLTNVWLNPRLLTPEQCQAITTLTQQTRLPLWLLPGRPS